MKRDRGLPVLEIELQPIATATGERRSRGRAPQPPSPPATERRPRRRTVAAVVAVVAIVVVTLSVVGGDGSDPEPEAADPAPTSASAAVASEKIWIPTPNILGAEPTTLLLWTFDSKYWLQVLDLDSGQLRSLGGRGGFALFPLVKNVIVFDGDNGSSVVSSNGATSTEQLGKGAYPVVERESRTFWVFANDAPRQWQKRAIDGTVLDVLPFDGHYGVVHYSDHAVLVTSTEGTSLFDLITRQLQFVTPSRVFAAGGTNLLARNCVDQRCTFTVFEFATQQERVLLSDIPVADANNAMLSPDGDFLAISRTDATFGRRAEIIAVSGGATLWQSPVNVVSSGSWSWSPDSRWFFAATAVEGVLAVDLRTPWVRTEIPISMAPLNGLAVTYR